MSNDVHSDPADQIRRLAGDAADLAAALDRVSNQWSAAEDAAEGVLANPWDALAEKFPFTRSLDELIASCVAWSQHLLALAAQSSTRVAGAAEAIRRHTRQLEYDVKEEIKKEPGRYSYLGDNPTVSEIQTHSVRNGLGGICGDYAAAASPAAMEKLADLLARIGDMVRRNDPIYQAADAFAEAYLAERRNDDTRHY